MILEHFMLKKNKSMLGKSIETFESIVGKTLRIEGDIVISKSLRVDGIVNGNIFQADGQSATVAIAMGASIIGNINMQDVIVSGLVKGNINSTGRVELVDTARVEGDLTYGSIGVAVGAKITGRLTQIDAVANKDVVDIISRASQTPDHAGSVKKVVKKDV